MNKLLITLCLLFVLGGVGTLMAQPAPPKTPPGNLWKTLAKVTFEKKYDELLGFKVDVPVFSDEIQELEAEEITISGYIVPVEGYKGHTEFVFSAYPYNMCFFCGGAGPETVMEVTATEAVKYSTDRITLKGKLLLNRDNINRLMYIMVDAAQVADNGK
jgi:hypothetical protein